MTKQRSTDSFTGLSEEVGARLAERRNELQKTLREVAAAAEMSASHLSDIENGRSQVSLPVLFRLIKSLDLTLAELLPRIGGSHAKGGALRDRTEASSILSHDQLELSIHHHRLDRDQTLELANPSLDDLLVHVLSGSIVIQANNQTFELGAGDTFDSERLGHCQITGTCAATTILTATRTGQL